MSTSSDFIHTIFPEQTLDALIKEIESKDNNYYTFDFKILINENLNHHQISAQDFWKLAKIKAKKVSLFVDKILSCDVIENAPAGFIRVITMPGEDVTQANAAKTVNIKERVVIDDASKTLLFFQLTTDGEILLQAINRVIEENQQLFFSGHYVYSIPKNSKLEKDHNFIKGSDQTLPVRVVEMVANMKKLALEGELEKVYRKLYP